MLWWPELWISGSSFPAEQDMGWCFGRDHEQDRLQELLVRNKRAWVRRAIDYRLSSRCILLVQLSTLVRVNY